MPLPQLLTLDCLCKRLQVWPETIRGWIATERFPAPVVLPDESERWREEDVEGWLARHNTNGNEIQLSELAWEILGVLRTAGAWLHGAEIGRQQNRDHKGGGWKRAMSELLAAELAMSNRKLGYRAVEADEAATVAGGASDFQ